MIVFDLRCAAGHVFEAWFGSSAAFEEQRAQRLVRCPVCDDASVEKAVMAPNIAPGTGREPPSPHAVKAALRAMATAQAEALKGSEWVGRAFPERARAMHAGEADPAPIHGQATRAEARALAEEGVPVAPLPLPVTPPDTAH